MRWLPIAWDKNAGPNVGQVCSCFALAVRSLLRSVRCRLTLVPDFTGHISQSSDSLLVAPQSARNVPLCSGGEPHHP
jgi:hypothetical protein